MILVISALFILLAIISVSWINLIWDYKSNAVPGPFPLPILGNGHLFLGDSAKFLKTLGKLRQDYGKVSCFYILSDRYLLVSSPEEVEAVVAGTELITKGRSYNFLNPWLGQGLLTSSGLKWKTHRKFLTPAFHFNILQNFLPIFIKNSKILVEKLGKTADNKPIDLFPVIALAALDNITESIMGIPVDAQMDAESAYVKAIEKVSVIVSERMRSPITSVDAIFNLLPQKTQQDAAIKILHAQTNKVIEARRRELKELNISALNYDSEYGTKNRHAFLDLLLLAEMDGNKIDDVSVREEVDTFMFEGHDTTTSAITFCLFCISKHPEVQEKILKEQRNILGEDIDRDATYSEVQQMKYLELVVKESLRLYPSVPLIERTVTQNTEINGRKILKDTLVLIDIYQMHRDPDFFDNPLEFRPERFQTTMTNPFTWIPFSAGPRNCIGQKFAMMEIKVVVSIIVRSFKIIPSGLEPELSADLILRSNNGVHINIKRR